MKAQLVRDEGGRIVDVAPYCRCGNPIEKGVGRRRRAMCNACWDDPVKKQRNIYARDLERFKREVDAVAEEETKHLPKGPPMIPAVLNRLIDEWGRA